MCADGPVTWLAHLSSPTASTCWQRSRRSAPRVALVAQFAALTDATDKQWARNGLPFRRLGNTVLSPSACP